MDCRYRIKHIIGEGASGTVYRAVDSKDGRDVAIKVHSGSKDVFDNECHILGELEHEHIVKLHGQDRSHGVLVLEICDYNLISFMNEHELDMRCIKRIVRMILLALRHMHGKGVIHRDIKLGNILVKGDSVKLCDFGLSCLKAQNDFSYCGTRDYLAPEMVRSGQFYDEKIDVFAAGVVCRTLVMRRKDVRLDVKRAGADIVDLLRNMMDPDPGKRYSAEQALRHRAFDEIFPEIPDFRTIRSFFRSTRHGIVGREQNHIQIQYQEGMEVMRIEAFEDTGTESIRWSRQENRVNSGEGRSGWCRCMADPRYRVAINGRSVSERFFTEMELKHYVFLCRYFGMVAERTVKVKIEEDGCKFTVNANNTKILEHKDYKVVKNSKGQWSFFGKLGKEDGPVPYDVKAVFDCLETKAMGIPHRCFFHYGVLDPSSSMSLPTLNDPLVKEYVFAREAGWCIKTRLRFTVLMNDGTRFELCANEHVMVVDRKRVPIGIHMPKHWRDWLRASRILLGKFMQK